MKGLFKSVMIDEKIQQKITGISYKKGCPVLFQDLRYIQVCHYDFMHQHRPGELIAHQQIASQLLEIFQQLYEAQYEIEKIRLIDEYNGDDEMSMADNNTSCFNHRFIAGTSRLSKHSYGTAIDINPLYNPYITYYNKQTHCSPPQAIIYTDRAADFPHKITEEDLCYKLFTAYGFNWGGHWTHALDYQHFDYQRGENR